MMMSLCPLTTPQQNDIMSLGTFPHRKVFHIKLGGTFMIPSYNVSLCITIKKKIRYKMVDILLYHSLNLTHTDTQK